MESYPPLANCWYLVGPTASGKSAVGFALARRIGAEILSLDSMAVYRGMDIGTAKPDSATREAVPHHLLDLVEPNVDFSIADYLAAAHAAAADVHARGRAVLFVGGTPLYLKALLCGLAEGPEPDWEARERLLAEARQSGPEALHRRLAEVDPDAAARLHPQDTRRIIRALEVFAQTGERISARQHHFHAEPLSNASGRVFILDWPRPALHARINARVDAMFAAGFVAEVSDLLAAHPALSRTALQAAGYREVAEHLAGKLDLSTAIDRTKARTRQLARRQLTWLRSLSGCHWIEMTEPVDVDQVAERILAVATGRD
jgi:tRNA dimethylallyltransferase